MAKEQSGHSYIFWSMPIITFSPVANFGDHPLAVENSSQKYQWYSSWLDTNKNVVAKIPMKWKFVLSDVHRNIIKGNKVSYIFILVVFPMYVAFLQCSFLDDFETVAFFIM